MKVTIVEVKAGSAELESVTRLWRANSDTLGFMPNGGFEDAARGRTLLAAMGEDKTVVGYVMFRFTREFAVIAHLCVAPERRGAGLARLLFDAVKGRCDRVFDIRLRCRRDFDVAKLWPKLGFIAAGEAPGRGKDSSLTLWRYELLAPPILGLLGQAPSREGPVRAVIDANVFFGIVGDSVQDDEARAISADWLGDLLDLVVTNELLNEIDRNQDAAERARQRARASHFHQVPRNVQREEAVLPRIREILPASDRPSALSDARQIAMTIAGDVGLFVTSDGSILDCAEIFDEEFGLQVKAPHEIIRQFDELRRQVDYRPRRLFLGPTIRAAAVRADDVDQLVDLMHLGQSASEPRRQTTARLRSYLARPDDFETFSVRKGDEVVAAYILERPSPDVMRVVFVGVTESPLGRTAARHYVQEIAAMAAREKRVVTEVPDPGGRVSEAMDELGFCRVDGNVWIKIGLAASDGHSDAVSALAHVTAKHPLAADLSRRMTALLGEIAGGSASSHLLTMEVERILWPLKVAGASVPTFLVPIQPRWARELFDRELAAGTLFGANPILALNAENVYYRAARPAVVTAPARVLWYVSSDDASPGSKSVRACSRIDEVVVGRPKDLFSRFRRLGVYEWSDVFGLAKGNLDAEIMSFRFSGTELFSNPVAWDQLQQVLVEFTGKGSPIASPVAIPEACFFRLYQQGVGDNVM